MHTFHAFCTYRIQFYYFSGSVDGKIKRWDLSGDAKKKETEIIKTVSKKDSATTLTSQINEKKTEKIELEENTIKYPRRRFLDFYFEDAIRAEEIRKKSAASGGGDNYYHCYFHYY